MLKQAQPVTQGLLPRIAFVIPHFNYAEYVRDALQSVLAQTHQNFECVIVDDASKDAQYEKLRDIVAALGDARITLLRNEKNAGQLMSFYRGLDQTTAEFVTLLDPDDRLAPNFARRMLEVHLNGFALAPIACCDQYYLRIGYGVTGIRRNPRTLDAEATLNERKHFEELGFHRYLPPTRTGWLWTSSSSMVFRSAALRLLRPKHELKWRPGADSYLAHGSHMLGGTLILNKPLVYRGIHATNEWLSGDVFSTFQRESGGFLETWSPDYRRHAVAAFLANGGMDFFPESYLENVLYSQFRGAEFVKLLQEVPELAALLAGDA